MGYWGVVLNVLKNADVVVLIADARMPKETENLEVIRKVEEKGRKLVRVFNKIDLVSAEDLKILKKEFPNAFFISAVKKKGVNNLRKYLENLAEDFSEPSLRVGVVGYPNAGKSSILNLLAPEAKAKVSHVSGTTKETQWIRVGRLRFMDSPGVIPRSDKAMQVALTAAKDPQKIKFPERVAMKIIEKIRKRNIQIIGDFYDFPVADLTDYEIFLGVGKKKGYLIKGGEVDERKTAIRIVDDWQRGKLGLK